ncbi:RDD family protein [Streptomyces sp. NPDC051315]|uniref:RDD family protein n=1 Tax=Streptomyces sp. NPDC051315 TaxID=3365650 RepID=UPI0037B7C6D2
MSAPTPAPGDDRPSEGYYPDPSIPGYVRYWNGAAWVPGTSRPAPADGEPLAPPPGARPAASPPAASAAPAASVEETGPHFFDEDPTPAGQWGEDPGPDGQFGAGPEPASAWGADRSQQSGFGGDQDRKVSWGSPQGPDPRMPAAQPDGRSAGTGGTATIPPAEPEAGEGDVPSDGTFVFRRPPAGSAPAGTPSGTSGSTADDGTMTFRAPGPRTPHQGGAPGAGPGGTGAPTGPGRATPGAPGTSAAAGFGAQGPVGAPGTGGTAEAAAGYGAQGPVGATGSGGAAVGAAFGAQGPVAVPGAAVSGAPAAAGGAVPAAKPGFAAGKAAAERAAAAQAAQAQAPAAVPAAQAPAGPQTGRPAAQAPAPAFPGPQQAAPGVPQQAAPGVPQQAAGPQPAAGAAPAAQAATPMSAGPGGGQPSWAQQVHRLAGAGDDQPVAPWKPPAEDIFQAAARRQAAARPAGLGKRLAARLVDSLVLGAVTSAAAVPLGMKAVDHVNDKIDAAKLTGETVTVWLLDGTTSAYLGIVLAVLLLFGIVYEALPTARWGRTLGKKLFGLEVRDIEGHEPPSFGAALRRWLVYSVPGLLAVGVVGVLWCLFDRPWRQCWHDKAAHTFVAG